MLLVPHASTMHSTFGDVRFTDYPVFRTLKPGQRVRTDLIRQHRQVPRQVQAQGFFDSIFKREEKHAPELVRLNTDDEGGLGQTSAELFGPLASLKQLFTRVLSAAQFISAITC